MDRKMNREDNENRVREEKEIEGGRRINKVGL